MDVPTSSTSNKEIVFLGNHGSQLLSDLNKERHDDDSYCDVILVVDHQEFSGHQCVLAKFSVALHKQFKNSSRMPSESKMKVTLTGVDANIMHLAIEYIYTTRIEINQDNVMKILGVCNQLQLDGLKQHCLEFFLKEMSPRNILGIVKSASAYNEMAVTETATVFLAVNLENLVEQPEFNDFDKADILSVLNSRKQKNDYERLAYKCIVKWTNHCKKKRKKDFIELLQTIKLHLLPTEFLEKVVYKEPLIIKTDACKNYLIMELFRRLKLPIGVTVKSEKGYATTRCTQDARKLVIIYKQSISLLDVQTLGKTELPTLPHECDGACVVSCYNKLYVIGGCENKKSILCLQINLPDDRWKEVGNTIEHRFWSKAYFYKGLVFITGGHYGSAQSSVECFDPVNDSPHSIKTTAMLEGRYLHSMVEYRGYLVCAGELKTIECFSYDCGSWQTVVPVQFGNITGAVSCKDLYVLDDLRWLYRLHPVCQLWLPVCELPVGADDTRISLAIDETIHCVGKSGDGWMLCSYDIETCKWSTHKVDITSNSSTHPTLGLM